MFVAFSNIGSIAFISSYNYYEFEISGFAIIGVVTPRVFMLFAVVWGCLYCSICDIVHCFLLLLYYKWASRRSQRDKRCTVKQLKNSMQTKLFTIHVNEETRLEIVEQMRIDTKKWHVQVKIRDMFLLRTCETDETIQKYVKGGIGKRNRH